MMMFCFCFNFSQEWRGPLSNNGVVDVENSRDFARFWSTLQLIFCMPTPDVMAGKDLPNMALFGEGWCWGGCLVLHLLSLRHRFEALDFSAFISRAGVCLFPTRYRLNFEAQTRMSDFSGFVSASAASV
jgi:hypothetical protein